MQQATRNSLRKRITKAGLALLACALWLPLLQASQVAAAQTPACTTIPCQTTWRVHLPLVAYAQPQTIFGVQMYGRFDQPGETLELARSANVSWLRTQIKWRQVEPVKVAPSEYDFSTFDAALLASMRQGIEPIVTILDNPDWAAQYLNGPIYPSALEEFGKFVAAAVERYDGDGDRDAPGSPVVRYWEFYNEPDSGDPVRAAYGQAFWGDYGAEYATMLCTARWYAKLANPEAKIVIGGVAHDWFRADGGPFVESFVEDLLSAGGGKCFDVMNFHYYPVFAGAWQAYGPGIVGKTEYFRILLAKHGLVKPIMCTEAGWHSDAGDALPGFPQQQAEFVVKLFAQARAADLVSNIWWTWMDLGAQVGSYGLVTDQLQPKPSYHAYRYAGARLGSSRFVRQLRADELGNTNLEGYLFSSGTPVYVLWSNDAATHAVRLKGAQARMLDAFGTLIRTTTDAEDGISDGQVTISVDLAPIYVETVP